MKSTALARSISSTGTAFYSLAVNEGFSRLFGLVDGETTELLLVRHAEPDFRPVLKNAAAVDPPLTERGRCQAMRLAMRLRREKIDAIYTSTARAALETAALVAAAKDMQMIRLPQIREVALRAAARSEADPARLAAEVAIRFVNQPRWDAIPWFEPSRQFRQRVIQAIEGIITHHPGKRVLAVTHQGVINAYLSMVLDIGRDMFFQPEFTSLSVVRVLRDLYGVQNVNDYSHLLPTFTPR